MAKVIPDRCSDDEDETSDQDTVTPLRFRPSVMVTSGASSSSSSGGSTEFADSSIGSRSSMNASPAISLPNTSTVVRSKTLSRAEYLEKVVIQTFNKKARECDSNGYPAAVAVILTLTKIVEASTATTFLQLQAELKNAMMHLKGNCVQHYNEISLRAVSELFWRFVFRTYSQFSMKCDFKILQCEIVRCGKVFARTVMKSRAVISTACDRFIRDGCVILTHSTSTVVLRALSDAALKNNRRFSVVVTESRPLKSGYDCARELRKVRGIESVKVILDSAVAIEMSKVDFVLVGAEGVVESGGIINRIGTYQMAIVAKAMGRPFYVAAESCKFSRMFPMTQSDIEQSPPPKTTTLMKSKPSEELGPEEDSSGCLLDTSHLRDYTPPEYITLLLTDLGILTPSAVSDELINLYSH